MAPLKYAPRDEVVITDNDVLFGRGGLTNRHTGNLRYRDLVSLHRPDYVNASKMDKPNVSRRIVMAIKSGPNAGRFLKKDDIGWLEVSDREATWKCSQALREKTRWSSMKKDETEEAQASASSIAAMSSPVQIIAGMAQDSAFAAARVLPMVDQVKPFPAVAEATTKEGSSTATETRAGATKRKADAPITEHGKKLKPDESPLPLQQKMSAIELSLLHGTQLAAHSSDNTPAYNLDMLTCDQISIPSLEGLDTSGLVPLPQGQSDIQPRDEDVLFGRGGKTNHHPGNKRLRVIVDHYRNTYCHAKKVDKPKVSKLIVAALRVASPPSRFLRLNEDTKSWVDVGDRRAAEKVSQTLREKDKDQKKQIKAAKAQAIAAIAHASVVSQHGNVPCNLPLSQPLPASVMMGVVESSGDDKTNIIDPHNAPGCEHSATTMASGLPGTTPNETSCLL